VGLTARILGAVALRRFALRQEPPPAAAPFTIGSHSDTARSRPGAPLPAESRHQPAETAMLLDTTAPALPHAAAAAPRHDGHRQARQEAQRIAAMLALVAERVPLQRRVVHAGDTVHRSGDDCTHLYLLNSGCCKIVNSAADGRAQMVGLLFRGDWLGFDGIAGGRYRCDAVALDTGEVWTLRYDDLMAACAAHPPLMALVHVEMSRVMGRDRDALMSLTTLSADARVAEFLRLMADALGQRGLRTDQITLRMTRAEIGNYLGLTLESVSRALSRLARQQLIGFADGTRREIRIPDVQALAAFVGCDGATLQ
jgi:CRP/FNR family transcriptional regulator